MEKLHRKINDLKKITGFSPGWLWMLSDFIPYQSIAWMHCSTRNQQNSYLYLQLIVETLNFLKQIFINERCYIFENLGNLRLFETNRRNIKFYRCCYFLNWWFYFIYLFILHKYAKISKVRDFSQVILKVWTFLAVDSF